MLTKLTFTVSVSWLLALSIPLSGCDAAQQAACADNTECAAGQSCVSGSCEQTATGGAGGSAAHAGSGSTASSAGSVSTAGQAGSVSAGGSSFGGNSATGGSSFGGNSATGGVNGDGISGGGSSFGGNSATGGSSFGGNSATGGSSFGGSSATGGMSGGSAMSSDTPGQCKDDYWPAANGGSVTRYDFKQGTSLPACSYVITHTGQGRDGDWDTVEGISTGDGGYFGAMNTTDYAQGAACGACVEASYNGHKVVLTIVDECPLSSNPKCTKGHIDLSRKAIRQLESNSSMEDLHNVSWHYVKCPASGNVQARLHPNQSADWQPIIIENGLYPLKSVTLNGKDASRTGNNAGGNGWIASGQKTPYSVRATDVNGGAISFSFSGPGLTDIGKQFTCQ